MGASCIFESNTRSFTDMEIKEGKKYSYMSEHFLEMMDLFTVFLRGIVVATIPALQTT
jgi:hypothetical protein